MKEHVDRTKEGQHDFTRESIAVVSSSPFLDFAKRFTRYLTW